MSKVNDETDAATTLTQMSQLVNVSFDLTTANHDHILEEDDIGATCTLQPSSLDADMFFPLNDDRFGISERTFRSDPYITFDEADHPYAVNVSETSFNGMTNKKRISKHSQNSSFDSYASSVDGTEHPYAISNTVHNEPRESKKKKKGKNLCLENSLVCLICNKTFKKLNSLMIHLKFHAGKRPYSCKKCTQSFTTKSDLTRHFLVHVDESEKEKFNCTFCSSTFRDQATKTRHMKTHFGNDKYQCDICNKSFSRSDSYKNHLNTHSESKQYKCSVCGSEFNYKSSYNRHVATHTLESVHRCDVCGKSFRRLDYVESHKKSVHSKEKIKLTKQKSCLLKVEHLPESKKNQRDSVTCKKKGKLCKLKDDNLKTSTPIESGEAVPILMSMAEKAKKPKKNFSEGFSSAHFLPDDGDKTLTSLQIDGNFMQYLNDTSNDEVSGCESCDDELSGCGSNDSEVSGNGSNDSEVSGCGSNDNDLMIDVHPNNTKDGNYEDIDNNNEL